MIETFLRDLRQSTGQTGYHLQFDANGSRQVVEPE